MTIRNYCYLRIMLNKENPGVQPLGFIRNFVTIQTFVFCKRRAEQ